MQGLKALLMLRISPGEKLGKEIITKQTPQKSSGLLWLGVSVTEYVPGLQSSRDVDDHGRSASPKLSNRKFNTPYSVTKRNGHANPISYPDIGPNQIKSPHGRFKPYSRLLVQSFTSDANG
jgi:hypothetical protein